MPPKISKKPKIKAAKGRKSVGLADSEVLEDVESTGPGNEIEEKAAKGAGKRGADSALVYKYLDLVGASEGGIEQAIQTALDRAATTVRHIDWIEVKEIRGKVTDGKVSQYQVHFVAGFKLEG